MKLPSYLLKHTASVASSLSSGRMGALLAARKDSILSETRACKCDERDHVAACRLRAFCVSSIVCCLEIMTTRQTRQTKMHVTALRQEGVKSVNFRRTARCDVQFSDLATTVESEGCSSTLPTLHHQRYMIIWNSLVAGVVLFIIHIVKSSGDHILYILCLR